MVSSTISDFLLAHLCLRFNIPRAIWLIALVIRLCNHYPEACQSALTTLYAYGTLSHEQYNDKLCRF